jgi:hypothetical protein
MNKGSTGIMAHNYKYPEEMEFERVLKQAKERMEKRRVAWLLDEVVRMRTKVNFLGRRV